MRRIIVIVVLSVITVVLSGCDKIKTELERRHLGTEQHKQTARVEKTPDDNHNDVAAPASRKQIVIRIDLPADEKLQVRLLKLPVSEDSPQKDIVSSLNEPPQSETIKEDALNAETLQNQSEKKIEPEKKESDKKTPIELEAPKSEAPQSEIKTDAEQEPKSEMKTDREEPFPAVIPTAAPTIIVPARNAAAEQSPSDSHVKSALSRLVKPNLVSAEAAVGSALEVSPPGTISPAGVQSLNDAAAAPISSSSSPWAIPNAEYPLRYY